MTKKEQKQDSKKELEELKKEHNEVKDKLLRLQAEFDNFRKRTDDERSRFITLANHEFIQKILPAMDNFERALETQKENTEFYKGVEMIYAQFKEILHEEGLTAIEAKGKFDPNLHEAILSEEGEENNMILQELQKGYKLGDRVIRHTKVKISKKGDAK